MNLDRKDLPIIYRMFLSTIILSLCIYMLVNSRFPSDYNKWAFGMIGVVVGYWLK